jgi:hypothetical protein
MSRIPQPRAGRAMIFFAGIVLALGIGAVLLSPRPQAASAPAPRPAPVPHFIDLERDDGSRLLVIGDETEMLPGTSNPAGVLMANLRSGAIPPGAAQAVVLTDTNCAPDADAISHCLNDLDIAGVVVTVQHHHDMRAVPCLSPGETVTLMTLAEYRQA